MKDKDLIENTINVSADATKIVAAAVSPVAERLGETAVIVFSHEFRKVRQHLRVK